MADLLEWLGPLLGPAGAVLAILTVLGLARWASRRPKAPAVVRYVDAEADGRRDEINEDIERAGDHDAGPPPSDPEVDDWVENK